MDACLASSLAAAAGILGTLAGVALADLLGARRQRRDRLRERLLAALQQTKQLVHAHLMDALAVAAGAPSTRVYGSDVYPLAETLLIGDGAALKLYLQIAVELLRHPRGTPARESQARLVAEAFAAVDAAIAAQEARVLDDKPIRRMSTSELSDLQPLFVAMQMSTPEPGVAQRSLA